jgi:myo-inositol 2-dehydrogenase/D-chiro-inositol 1-dehydrogenase
VERSGTTDAGTRGGGARRLRVAVVGCGGMGTRHTMLLGTIPDAEVTLFVDPVAAAIERIRERSHLPDVAGVAAIDDPAVAERADAVVIATHHDLHPGLAVAAAEAGKHIFIEKPMALTLGACREIEAAVARNGVQLMVGFQARHSPFVRLAREAVPRPRVLVGEMIDPVWPSGRWSQDPVAGGGNVLSQGVHTFDLLCFLAGSEPVSLHAEGGTFTHAPAATAVTDSVVATIRFANGAVAAAIIGDFGPDAYVGKSFYQLFDAAGRSATVYGYYTGVRVFDGERFTDHAVDGVTRGRLVGMGRTAEPESAESSTAHLPAAEAGDALGPYGYVGELAEFVHCALENRPPRIGADATAGTRATRLALACFESIRSGHPVSLAPVSA